MKALLAIALVCSTVLGPRGVADDEQPKDAAESRREELTVRLNAVQAQIDNARQELDMLRTAQMALVKELRALDKEPDEVKVFASLEELLSGLPENARPAGPDDDLQRIRANDWLRKKETRDRVKLERVVEDVDFSRSRSGELKFDARVRLSGHEINLFDQKFDTRVAIMDVVSGLAITGGAQLFSHAEHQGVRFLDDAAAERLRDAKGKSIALEGELLKIEFESTSEGLVLFVILTDVSLDGAEL